MEKSIKLPEYFGLGILNPMSVVWSNKGLYGEYTLFGNKISEIILTPDKFFIKEFWEGRIIRNLEGSKIKDLVSTEYAGRRREEDPRYKFLQQRVCELGNIYFDINPFLKESKKEGIHGYFQEEKKLIFRMAFFDYHYEKILIANPKGEYSNMAKWDWDGAFNKLLDCNGFEIYKCTPLFYFQNAYFSTLKLLTKEGQTKNEEVMIFEVVVPIAYVYKAAKWFCKRGLILPDKKYRLVIQDFECCLNESIQTFGGNPNDSIINYYLHYKGKRQDYDEFEKKDKKWKDLNFNIIG